MPSPDALLTWATAVANDWRGLAVAWHALLAGLIVVILGGWRPSARLLGYVVVALLGSVSVIAWLSGNPFNASVFAMLAAALAAAAFRFATAPATAGKPVWIVFGAVFATIGWTYPHFVRVDSWATYVYASPLGLLPCPTLLFVIGMTLMFQDLRSAVWTVPLAIAGLLYGAIGIFRLAVVLDWGLLAASATLTVMLARDAVNRRSRSAIFYRASMSEARRHHI